jgi:hypothetical protein
MDKTNRFTKSLLRISEVMALSASAAIHAMALEKRGEDMVDVNLPECISSMDTGEENGEAGGTGKTLDK